MQDVYPSSMELIHIDSIKTSNAVLCSNPLNDTDAYEGPDFITERIGEHYLHELIKQDENDA